MSRFAFSSLRFFLSSALALSLSVPLTSFSQAQESFQPIQNTIPSQNNTETESDEAVRARQAAMASKFQRRRLPESVQFTPNLIADIAESMAPSVVNIDVEQARKGIAGSGFPFDTDLLRRFFGFDLDAPLGAPKPPASEEKPESPGRFVVTGNGSGMILNSQGYILTNNHVISSADKMTVTLNDGRRFPARLVGRDSYSDVAVVKIDASKLKPVILGDSDTLRPGEWVIAVGSPLGFDHTVTQGIVNALSRRIPELNTNLSFIQTDAAINPGNSGGPLVNLKGEVVGVNAAISGKGQNIGFAIPINTVKEIANTLIAGRAVVRPWLGIAMMDLNPEIARSMNLPTETKGVVIARVVENSPAQTAGVQNGDLLLKANGVAIHTAEGFQEFLHSKAPSTPLTLELLRNGKPLTVHLMTGTLPGTSPEMQASRSKAYSLQKAFIPPVPKSGKVQTFSGQTADGSQYWGYTQQSP
jgi:serine protease Do